ncbi:hypothetical protein HY988_06180 [Candidatus Micrarchaeota archaeon]|nr:hypothetical protein [Candidatus Micrarchaeota archaeon]
MVYAHKTYATQLLEQEVLHYPTLKTVLQVEEVLMNSQKAISREGIKRALGGKIMHQTLNLILHYLDDSGKIYIGEKGIVWIYNPSKKLGEIVRKGVEH